MIPESGPLDLAMFNAEFGFGNDLASYIGRPWVKPNQGNLYGTFVAPLGFDQFYGTQSAGSGFPIWTTPGTYNWQVPPGVTQITLNLSGGGGGASSGSFCGDAFTGGGGGSGGRVINLDVAVNPGETLTIIVGAGGAGGVFPGACAGHTSGSPGFNTNIVGSFGEALATGGGQGLQGGSYPGQGVGGSPGTPNGAGGANGGGCGVGGQGGNNGSGYGTGGQASCNSSGNPGQAGFATIAW